MICLFLIFLSSSSKKKNKKELTDEDGKNSTILKE